MVQTENLTFSYQGGTTINFPDIHCATGEHWLLLGQSGSGKTTLLNLLAGLRTPNSGIVRIGDIVLNKLPSSRLDTFRGQNIGIIFQQSYFLRALTVVENLMLAQQLAGMNPDRNRIKEVLERLSVAHKLHRPTTRLSVGEQQRVAIARAVINQPTLILADEPTSALDDANTAKVIHLLKKQAEAVNATLFIVTHDNRLKKEFSKQIEL